MKTLSLVFAAWTLLAAGAGAQTVSPFANFERALIELPKPALSSLQDYCRVLRESRDVKEQVAALQAIEDWMRPVSPEEEMLLVAALKDAASNPTLDMGVRSRAVHALGKACSWIRTDMYLRDAMAFMAEIVEIDHPLDSRRDLRRPALMGLAKSVRYAPVFYRDLIESILRAAFRVLRDNNDGPDNFLAMTIVYEHIRAAGLQHLLGSSELSSRVEQDLIVPLESNLQALYGDRNRGTDYRYQLVRTLRCLSWVRPDAGYGIGHRSMQILKNMRYQEPDPGLRRLVELCVGERRF